MKVMHVLNSRIYSGAEKVVCQIIKSFRDDAGMEMVYCSPESDIVRQMLSEQDVTYLPMETMSAKELRRVIAEQKPDLIHAHDMRASFFPSLMLFELLEFHHRDLFCLRTLLLAKIQLFLRVLTH